MSLGTAVGTRALPSLVLLLYTDRADPIARVLLEQAGRFHCEVLALSLAELVDEVSVGSTWSWAGRSIEPSRTAVVNRIVSIDNGEGTGPFRTPAEREQFWSWLSVELERFVYVSAMPSAISPVGSVGSLLDQWLDLPELVAGLRVPAHRHSGSVDALGGDVHVVDPWQLYSLGRRATPQPERVPAGHVAYARPPGRIFHVAQIGEMFIMPNAPPQMSPEQHRQVASFARSMATLSRNRILEHAFFDAESHLVFYSTCPVPVITGRFPAYADFVVAGLHDDFKHRG
jgi:hypothetical protein